MNNRCLSVIVLSIVFLACSAANGSQSHKLVKRQFPPRPGGGGGGVPLSRSRQFPPPEELDESEEYENSESEEKSPSPGFRGRQPPQAPPEEEYADDYTYTEAPKTTTPAPAKPTVRTVAFNRFGGRPRFGAQSTTKSTTQTPKPSAASPSRSRGTTPAQSEGLDVVASIVNKPVPQRSASRAIANAKPANENADKQPEVSSDTPARRNGGSQRIRTRGRPRTRSTTTTTTTTTTTKKPEEDYYYYYEDSEESQENQPIATTTSTTTTTTTPRPRSSISRPRPSSTRSRTTSRPVVKFDPESQFAPPPEDIVDAPPQTSSTKRFTTSSTMSPEESGGIPPHLRSKYRPRTDGRFIDFLRDPNRPRELKGFDLTDYPFYILVPEDIDFECDDKKDGYYASIPHRCQLFHYCFAGARYDFLCANYTLYDQTTFTCRFANNVDCEGSAKYYYRNDDLWKETTTTTVKPETTTRRRRKSTPKEEEYDDDEYYYDDDEEDEEQERRRRPAKRRRNRRKNRRNQSDDQE